MRSASEGGATNACGSGETSASVKRRNTFFGARISSEMTSRPCVSTQSRPVSSQALFPWVSRVLLSLVLLDQFVSQLFTCVCPQPQLTLGGTPATSAVGAHAEALVRLPRHVGLLRRYLVRRRRRIQHQQRFLALVCLRRHGASSRAHRRG